MTSGAVQLANAGLEVAIDECDRAINEREDASREAPRASCAVEHASDEHRKAAGASHHVRRARSEAVRALAEGARDGRVAQDETRLTLEVRELTPGEPVARADGR